MSSRGKMAILSCPLCPSMTAADFSQVVELACEASGVHEGPVELLSDRGIGLVFASAYHPQSNARTECSITYYSPVRYHEAIWQCDTG